MICFKVPFIKIFHIDVKYTGTLTLRQIFYFWHASSYIYTFLCLEAEFCVTDHADTFRMNKFFFNTKTKFTIFGQLKYCTIICKKVNHTVNHIFSWNSYWSTTSFYQLFCFPFNLKFTSINSTENATLTNGTPVSAL